MKVTNLQEARSLLAHMKQSAHQHTSTGYASLDQLTGGLIRGAVTLIGGRVAMGRSSLVLNMVSRISTQQTGTILVFSPRYNTQEMTMRLLSIGMNLAAEKLLDGSVSAGELECRYAAFMRSQKSNIKIIPLTLLNLKDIQYYCERAENLQLVVIDGLERICRQVDYSSEPVVVDTPRESMDQILTFLKKLALSRNVPVIGTVTVPRSIERRKNKRPKLSDLKKMDVPEKLVDQIMFLHRDSYYDPFGCEKTEVIVAKDRIGTVELDCNRDTGRFDEVAHT